MAYYDPRRHGRRSIRLKGYDYSRAGGYFVTICTQGRAHLFGEVVRGVMRLNDAGRMIRSVWDAIPAFYPCVRTDEFVVMPDHVHGIVVIVAGPAALRGRLWQRNYYECIIRSEAALGRIRRYIVANPAKWGSG